MCIYEIHAKKRINGRGVEENKSRTKEIVRVQRHKSNGMKGNIYDRGRQTKRGREKERKIKDTTDEDE